MRSLGGWNSSNGPSWLVSFRDIDEQLTYLRSVVDEWRGSPLIRNLAVSIIKNTDTRPKDKKGQALAVGQYVQTAIYYVHELPERFQTPAETLRLKAGDCDDTTVLVCCLLEALGIPSALVCMKFDGDWRHIFSAAILPGGRFLPLDTTLNADVAEIQNPCTLAAQQGKTVVLKIVA